MSAQMHLSMGDRSFHFLLPKLPVKPKAAKPK